jgi:hypothetical protein
MSYIYTFINHRTKERKEVEGVNLWDGIAKLNMVVSSVETLGRHYLQSTPFEQRERIVWGGNYGNEMYIVKQKRK